MKIYEGVEAKLLDLGTRQLSCQLHVLAALQTGKYPLMPNEQEAVVKYV
jgi:hypothetical protein